MHSPVPSLLLAMSLGVVPAIAAAQPSSTPTTAQVPPRPVTAPAPTPAGVAPTSGTTKQAAKAKTSKSATPKAGKSAPGPSSGKTGAGKAAKTAKTADCDTPEAKVAAATPPPVAADPLSPTLAPCAEPTRKP